MLTIHEFGLAAAIIVGALVSEDAAIVAAATLWVRQALDIKVAWLSAVIGISVGDYGLFAMARLGKRGALNWQFARRAMASELVDRCQVWLQKYGKWLLFFSRAIPGMRLPTTLACGVFGMSALQFLLLSVAGASLWVVVTFFFVHRAQQSSVALWPLLIVSLVASVVAARSTRYIVPRLERFLRKLKRWEFWPAWLFYIPVVAMYAWLGLRFRGFALPAVANPGQLNGGMVGESKAEILADLYSATPGHVARAFLLSGSYADRLDRVYMLLDTGQLEFPFVLKPNVAQRGAGFRVIRNEGDFRAYLTTVPADLIAQQYASGPREIGIFYYRMPDTSRGHILAITEKLFPTVRGDGRRTVRELIEADERAAIIASTYMARLGSRADTIPAVGEVVRLVEAGNHCQGCIFTDGAHLAFENLLNQIDQISQSIPEFYIGRYDIRYATDDDLREGRFTIIELNGAASEATSIYDPRNSLWSAYGMLYRQWRFVFEIGCRNRERGFQCPSLLELWRTWREYCRISEFYPIAD